MHDEKAAAGIRALAPAVICVGCLSAFRGYTQGHTNMTPTAVSQIIEALCKLVIGLALAYWLISNGATQDVAAAGAITGVTVGTVMALGYMILTYLRGRGSRELSKDRPDEAGAILKSILQIAIPITLSSSMVGIVTVIDSSLVQGQLQRVLLENPDSWQLYQEFIDFSDLTSAMLVWQSGFSDGAVANAATLAAQVADNVPAAVAVNELILDVSRTLYGNYSSALTIYNLPTSLMAAITASVIPAVSAALARSDKPGAARVSGSALRITALLAFPMGVGLFVMGTPIIQLLFPALTAEIAGPLLSELGIATLFVCMMLVCNSILQAHGFVNLPVIVMLLGGLLKIFNNYNLVGMPSVGIYGAPFGNVLCFGLCMILDLIIISRVIPGRPSYVSVFAKPAAASALMGLGAWGVDGLASKVLGDAQGELSRSGNLRAPAAAIGVAVIIYGVLVIVLRAISKDDLKLMPKGEKIAKLLHL